MIKQPPLQEPLRLDTTGRITSLPWVNWLQNLVGINVPTGELVSGSNTPSITIYHSSLIGVEQADDTSSNIDTGKHVTDAQLKVYGDHVRLTDSNPHGTDHSQLDLLGADDHPQYLLLLGRTGQIITGPIQIGDGNNYIEFESDGSMLMVGTSTVFDDLVAAISGTVVSGVGVSVSDTEQVIVFSAAALLTDYAWTSYQLKHAWKPGSVIQPHVHWEQASVNVPNWLLQYRWQKNGTNKTTSWTNYLCNTTVFTYTSGTINQICHGSGITPPSGYTISDIVQVRILRDTANTSTLFSGADAYAGSVNLSSSDVHIEMSRLGSRTEYAF